MSVLHEFPYLKLYWISQSLIYLLLIFISYLNGKDKSTSIKATEDKIGLLNFRKRRTTVDMIGLIWTLYMGYKTVGSYCFGLEQSKLVADIGAVILEPRHVTTDSTGTLLALIMLVVHCTRRLYEDLRVSIHSGHVVQGLVSFINDHFYHVAVGLSLIAESPLLLKQDGCIAYQSLRLQHIFAGFLFIFATRVQHETLQYFTRLRKNKSGHIVTTQYKQPKDGWFETLNVSSPQYFAEILIYISVGLLLGFSGSTWWILTAFIIVHHVHLASKTHQYYLHKFEDYPKNRKMIIPYVI